MPPVTGDKKICLRGRDTIKNAVIRAGGLSRTQ